MMISMAMTLPMAITRVTIHDLMMIAIAMMTVMMISIPRNTPPTNITNKPEVDQCANAQSHRFKYGTLDIIGIVEDHAPPGRVQELTDAFSIRSMRLIRNPARPSSVSENGTHGGEFVGCKTYHDITHIDNDPLDLISRHTDEPLSVSAALIRLKDVSVLLVVCYLWSGQGLSQSNFNILKQNKLLRELKEVLSGLWRFEFITLPISRFKLDGGCGVQ